MWIQTQGADEDEKFSDDVSYDVLKGGVLKVTRDDYVYLYSPAYWQEVTIDTRSKNGRQEPAKSDADLQEMFNQASKMDLVPESDDSA
jgi:hypothetical protein